MFILFMHTISPLCIGYRTLYNWPLLVCNISCLLWIFSLSTFLVGMGWLTWIREWKMHWQRTLLIIILWPHIHVHKSCGMLWPQQLMSSTLSWRTIPKCTLNKMRIHHLMYVNAFLNVWNNVTLYLKLTCWTKRSKRLIKTPKKQQPYNYPTYATRPM